MNYLKIGFFRWFQGFDWDGLSNLTLLPPIIHPLRNPLDTAYFDVFPVDTEIPPNEFSGWDVVNNIIEL